MLITLENAVPTDYQRIKPLYKKAFPLEERFPFFFLKYKAEHKKALMLVAKERNTFIGFTYLIFHQDMAYLFFFAIDEKKRGAGYGSKVLKKLREHCRGMRIFLACEQLDENAPNYQERLRRHEFYIHNGFTDLPCKIKEAKVVYSVMGTGGDISKKEYEALITRWCGKRLRKLLDMRIID